MTRLAHISDLHILDVTGVPIRRFLNKRITGAISLLTARRGAHSPDILKALVKDLQEQEVDHVAVTGDISNLSLETEFTYAKTLLAPVASYDMLSLVPGNHDIYTAGAARSGRFEQFFGEFLWADGVPPADLRYPWHKTIGNIHLVGLCSALTRPILFADGEVGEDQLNRLIELHKNGRLDDGVTVVMVHHNLHPRGYRKDWMHGLMNRNEVLAACGQAGVDMILHGHTHVAHRFRHGQIEVVGSGSSTWNSDHPAHTARYNIYQCSKEELGTVQTRIYDHGTEAFRTLSH